MNFRTILEVTDSGSTNIITPKCRSAYPD